MTYDEFLKKKIDIAEETGISVDPEAVNPALKPHQRDAVLWALRGGRRALFESFGLGKTVQQLEWARILNEATGVRVLIVCPLGVKQEFQIDAVRLLGWVEAPPYVRTDAEAAATDAPVVLTNYERVRDGDIDPKQFGGVSLDEASCLRSYGSKTYTIVRFALRSRGAKPQRPTTTSAVHTGSWRRMAGMNDSGRDVNIRPMKGERRNRGNLHRR